MSNGQSAYERKTIEFYDSIAEDYRSLYSEATPGGRAFVIRRERALELFDKPAGRVLDVGCGPGIVVDPLLAQGCSYHGVDPSAKMVAEGKRRYRDQADATFSVGTVTQLEYPDDYFDAVICLGVLERVEDDDRAISEMLRVMKTGGTLIVALPNRFCPFYLWRNIVIYPIVALLRPIYRALSGKPRSPVLPGHRLYSARSISARLEGKGFRVTDIVFCVYSPLYPPLDAWFPRLAVSLMNWAERLRRGRPTNLGAALIVKARKIEARAINAPAASQRRRSDRTSSSTFESSGEA